MVVPDHESSGTLFPSIQALRSALGALLRQLPETFDGGAPNDQADTAIVVESLTHFIARASRTGAVLADEQDRDEARSVLSYLYSRLIRADSSRIWSVPRLAEFQPELLPDLTDDLCPFPGQRSFSEADAPYFHGRTQFVEELHTLAGAQRLVAVIGPAGSGKSSAVWAGLVPLLRNDDVEGSTTWHILPPIFPGMDPLNALAKVLLTATPGNSLRSTRSSTEFAEQLRHDPTATIRELATPIADAPSLLVVEQLEDLFALCDDPSEITAFMAALVALITLPSPRYKLILTMRSEAEPLCARFPVFWEYLSAARIGIPLMGRAELRRAIEAPGHPIGLVIESEVVEAMIRDGLNQPAAPLLLQCSLRALWAKRERNRITTAAYRVVGSGSHVLATRAEAMLAQMTLDEQALTRRLLLGLVRTNDRGLVLIRECQSRLAESSGESDLFTRILGAMVDAGIVRVTGDPLPSEARVEIAHESLLTNWPVAVTWLRNDRALLDAISLLETRARAWSGLGRGKSGLLDEGELYDADRRHAESYRVFLLAGRLIPPFLEASRSAVAEQRRAELAYRQRLEQANHALIEQRRVIDSQRLAFAARSLVRDDPEIALLLAREAASIDDNSITAQSLRDIIDQVLWIPTPLLGHDGAITQLAFRPDGTRLATASEDHTVCLWDATGALVVRLKGHEGPVTCVAFRPDGLLASGGADASVCLWRSDGTLVARFREHTRAVTSLAFSLDGRYLATGGADALVIVRSLTDRKVLRLSGHSQTITSVQFSHDGKRLVTASEDWTARVWDMTGGFVSLDPTMQISLAEGGGFDLGAVHNASFHPNGHYVVTATNSRKARLWAINGELQCDLHLHSGVIWHAAFSPDGQILATASDDGTAGLWTAEGTFQELLCGHHAAVRAVAFSTDSQLVLTASDDGTARLWDNRGRLLTTLSGHTGSVTSAQFGPHHQIVATGSSDGTARIWRKAEVPLATLSGHGGPVYDASYAPDGQSIVTASGDGTARLWDLRGEPVARPLSGNEGRTYSTNYQAASDAEQAESHYIGPVRQAIFRPDSAWVMLVSEDEVVRLWHRSGQARMRFRFSGDHERRRTTHSGIVQSASFSPNGELIVTASADRTARIWRITELFTADYISGVRHDDVVYRAVFSPDGALIVTASADRTARVVTASGEPVRLLAGHTAPLTGAIFRPDSLSVITSSADGTARLWQLEQDRVVVLGGNLNAIQGVACSPDGTLIVTVANESVARVWDSYGECLAVLSGHRGPVLSAAFSPDGALILTASADRTARLWTTQGELIGILSGHAGTVWSARFSADGQRVITASEDGTARQYMVSTTALLALTQQYVGRSLTEEEHQRFQIKSIA